MENAFRGSGTDSVNTDHSDGTKTERKRDASCESALSVPQ